MALQAIQYEAACGSAYAVDLELRGYEDDLVTTWTDAATFAVRAWQGGDQATAFTPTAAWVTPETGVFRLSIAEGDTDDVTPGLYQLAVAIDGGPWGNIGTMRLTPGVGTAEEPPTYCTLLDMVALCPWIEDIEDLGKALSSGLKTNFLKQRAMARVEIDRNLMARAEDNLLYQRRLSGPTAWGYGSVSLAGADSGPWFGSSTLPDSDLSDALDPIRAALADDGAIDGADATGAEVLRRIAANYALHFAMRSQLGGPAEGVSYRDLAMGFRSEAIRLMQGWRATVVVDDEATYWL